MVKVAILDREAAQFAAIPLIFSSIGLIVSYIFAFVTPWVKCYIIISQNTYKMSIPIEIGLVKCFSPICDQYKDLIYPNGIPFADFSFTPHILPSPPDIGKAIEDEIKKYIRSSINTIKKPFVQASVVTVPILSLSCCLCIFSLITTVFYVFTNGRIFFRHQQSLLCICVILNAFAVIWYAVETYSSLNGGEYESGLWIVLSTTAMSTFFAIVSTLILNSEHCCKKYKKYPYEQIIHLESDSEEAEDILNMDFHGRADSISLYPFRGTNTRSKNKNKNFSFQVSSMPVPAAPTEAVCISLEPSSTYTGTCITIPGTANDDATPRPSAPPIHFMPEYSSYQNKRDSYMY